MMPTFSFLVPTHREDRPLERCLDSLAPQLGPLDEVLVMGDTFAGDLPGVAARVAARYDRRFRYIPYNAGHSCWGHCQLNYGLEQAQGEWLHVNDDDDIWTPGAVNMMRSHAAAGPRPMLFRFVSYVGMVFWTERGRLERNWIGGHCLVAPNIPGKVGRWGEAYNGDFDYIEQTVELQGGPEAVSWLEPIVAIARPTLADQARLEIVGAAR